MTDAIPLVSQVKSLVQWLSGDSKGAENTQINFSRQCPIVSQVRSAAEAFNGDSEAARETQVQCLQALGGVVDAVPLVGHVKAVGHYAFGDTDGGNKSIEAATRTCVVVIGGAGGFFAGGVPGAVGGGVAAGAAYDGAATGVASAIHNEYEPHGIVKVCTDAHFAEGGEKSGPIFDAICLIVGDAATGYAVGKFMERTNFKVNQQVDLDIPPDNRHGLTCLENDGCATVYAHTEEMCFSKKEAIVNGLKKKYPGQKIHLAAGAHGCLEQGWNIWDTVPNNFLDGKLADWCKSAPWAAQDVIVYDMTDLCQQGAFEAATRKPGNVCYISWCHGTHHAWVTPGQQACAKAAVAGAATAAGTAWAKGLKSSSSESS